MANTLNHAPWQVGIVPRVPHDLLGHAARHPVDEVGDSVGGYGELFSYPVGREAYGVIHSCFNIRCCQP